MVPDMCTVVSVPRLLNFDTFALETVTRQNRVGP